MPVWILVCPNCGTENEADREGLRSDCGTMFCKCTCINCGQEFEERQEYWRWLGLGQGPPRQSQDTGDSSK